MATNYPQGFANGLLLRGLPIQQTNPGRVFWLSNSTAVSERTRVGSDNSRGTYDQPFATLAYAISQCLAGRGDVIMVKPGHAENIASATACPANISGVAVVGLGSGTLRPTFTFTTANTATIPVSAANVGFQNCVFTANFLSIAAAFTLSTAKGFTVESCLFNETSSTLNFLNCIKSTGAANTVDSLVVADTAWNGLGTTSVNSFVLSANDIDNCRLSRNRIILARTATAASLLTVTAGVLTNFQGEGNRTWTKQTASTGGAMVNVGGTTSSGFLHNNFQATLDTAGDLIVTGTTGIVPFENNITGAIAASGFIIPTRDT